VANIKRANASGITKSGTAISDVPDAPTIGAVSDLGTGSTASVAYTAATTGGAATTFTATSSPGGFTGTGSSPITVSGLTDSVAYTFTVVASNSTGSSPASSASSSVTLAIPGKFESIATATGTGSSATITFTSIPSTYQHLQIRTLSISASSDAAVYLRCNGVSANTYAQQGLFGNGSSVSVPANFSQTEIYQLIRSTATYPSVGIIDIHDYASSTKKKTIKSFMGEDANGSGRTGVFSGLFNSTAAITSLTFVATQNFATSTVFALYGIKGA
jgi:hypothetical protein